MSFLKIRQDGLAKELINNIPYFAMIVVGAATFAVGFVGSKWGLITPALYLAYGAVGAFWIMMFVCPYCRYWNSRSCPCGYGRIAARLRKQCNTKRFKEKFKRHIPVIVPLWFLPIVAGVPIIIRSFSWMHLVLIGIFVFDAFVILPLVSIKHGCGKCPQKAMCPWMQKKS
ncbi:hypothetical protein ES705_10965 [subsurface metagenome]